MGVGECIVGKAAFGGTGCWMVVVVVDPVYRAMDDRLAAFLVRAFGVRVIACQNTKLAIAVTLPDEKKGKKKTDEFGQIYLRHRCDLPHGYFRRYG